MKDAINTQKKLNSLSSRVDLKLLHIRTTSKQKDPSTI